MFTEAFARRQRGVTLIELIIFILIISIALLGIIGVLRFTTANSADPLRRKQALMLAEGLLEEVQLAKFTYCDPTDANASTATSAAIGAAGCASIVENFGQAAPEPAGPRPYDNVNDYVGTANVATAAFNNAAGKLADINGDPMLVSGYSVLLTITPEALGGIASSADVLRISVEVSYDGQKLVLDGYRTRYAPNAL